MVNIFTANIDYIIFLYIISLFALSTVCFIYPSQKRNDSVSFYSLGLFFLFHGLGEWVNIFTHILGGPILFLFLAIDVSIFIISYFLLFHFAAQARHILFLKPVRKWVYILLAVLCLLSFVNLGAKGTLSAAHFFFALFIGVYCALTIYIYSYREESGRYFRIFSLFLAAYFILRGLIVPKSSFFISQWVNCSLFKSLFGFPVELALIVLIFAAAFVFLVNVYRSISRIHTKYGRKTKLTMPLFMLLIFITLVLAGSVLIFYWGTYTKQEKRKVLLLRVENISNHIKNYLAAAGNVSHFLAVSYRAKDALKYRNDLAIKELNGFLDDCVDSFGVGVCYVMDTKGLVIASSNRNSSTSFLGKNYAFRPYFRDALRGKQGGYFALGVTSRKRGFYASYPVKDEWGNIIGVSVVKVNIGTEENILKSFSRAFLVSPEGIIFMSSDKQYLFRRLYPVENIYKQKIISSRQFGNVNFKPLLKKEYFQDGEVSLGNNLYCVFRKFIGYGGWSVVILWDNKPVIAAMFIPISLTLFIVILFILFVVILSKKEEVFNRMSQVLSEYKAVLKGSSGVVIISVNNEGRILSSNIGAEIILGYEECELRGKNIIDCIFAKDEVEYYASVVTKKTGRFLEGFSALVDKAKSNIITQMPCSLVRKDKTIILANLSITPKHGHGNEITGFIFTAVDITEFKKIQEQLRNEKNRITMYLDAASVMMVMLDKKGEVVFINKKGSDILGYNSDEIIGKDWFSNFLPDEEKASVKDVFNKLIQGEEADITTHTNYILAKSGKKLIFWHNTVIYDDKGQISGVLASGNDISERIEKEEELREKVDELEKFQKFVVDREIKMMELKKRIRELEGNSS